MKPVDGSRIRYGDQVRLALIDGHHYSMAEATRACGLYGGLIETGHRLASPASRVAVQIARRDRAAASALQLERRGKAPPRPPF